MSWNSGPDWDSGDVTSFSIETVYSITDSNGDSHQLYVSYYYYEIWIDNNGNIWELTYWYYCGSDAINAFFDEHTSGP